MSSIQELVARHREVLQGESKPTPGPPVLLQAAASEEILLPLSDHTPVAIWRTERIQIDPTELQRHERERVERMMALQDLVADQSAVLRLVKAGQNPSPHVCLGRAKRNDIVLPDATVSSVHAHFEDAGEGTHVRDLGSSNGTFVNRRRLREQELVRLTSGDCLRFGRQVFYYLSGERLLLFLELRMVRRRH